MSNYIVDILHAYKALEKQNAIVRSMLTKEANMLSLPPVAAIRNEHITCAEILTRLFRHPDGETDAVEYGIWLASPALVKEVELLNSYKKSFAETIVALKKQGNKNKSLKVIFERAERAERAGQRNEAVADALKTMRLSQLDLQACYREIRVLPAGMKSIQWMYEKRHINSKSVDRSQVEELIVKMDERLQPMAWDLLNSVPDNEFSIAKETSRRYLANIIWEGDTGQAKKTVHTSSIVLCPSETLPVCKWASDQEKERKPRKGKRLSEHPLIEVLNLHRHEQVA